VRVTSPRPIAEALDLVLHRLATRAELAASPAALQDATGLRPFTVRLIVNQLPTWHHRGRLFVDVRAFAVALEGREGRSCP
jgi:hypothetical protein